MCDRQDHENVVEVIRALLKELNHNLVCSQRSSPDGKPHASPEHDEVQQRHQERIAKDAKTMVKSIEFHADMRHDQSGATTLVANDSTSVILFWRGLSIALKKKYIREFVECEYTHLSEDQRERVYSELDKKMLRGTLDSRVQWNGYHIECVRGLSVTLPPSPTDDGNDDSEVSATSKTESAIVMIDFVDDESSDTKKAAVPKKKRKDASSTTTTSSTTPSVRNLRTQIQRQKKEAQMRLNGELDDVEDVYKYKSPFRRRW